QITREMGITLERTGGTVTTTQQHDYNASLYRPDGEIMAAGETYGHHVVCAGFAVKHILETFDRDEIFPDDMFLLNDPYLAAIHNPDVDNIRDNARSGEMFGQYEAELMNSVTTEMIRYTETVLRQRLSEIADGEWRETLTLEADGPCRLVLTLRKQGDRLIFDFTGTDG